jgi:multisubunit Na+/H+ antiporter MnhF subunit
VNAWYVAAAILPAGLLGPLWVAARKPPLDGVVGLQAAATIAALELVVLGEAMRRQPLMLAGLVLAAVSWPGTLAFLRYLQVEKERP